MIGGEVSQNIPGKKGGLIRRRRRNDDDRHHRKRRSPSRSGSPDEYKENACLYVTNLSTRVKERHLEEMFGEIGEVDRIMIVKHPYTKESRGFAFINFKSADKAKDALEKLSGQELYGNQLKIEFAKRNQPRKKTPGKYLGTGRDTTRPSYNSRYSRPEERDYDRPRR